MVEKYVDLSPYDYVGGNPISRVDPDGMDWYSHTDDDGNESVVWVDSQDKTYEKDGVEYKNIGDTYSFQAGDMYFHFYQNYQVGSSSSEIDVKDFVLNDRSLTNQLLNKLDGKYANELFAQAVNHSINTDGTKTALLTLAVPASIIGAAEIGSAQATQALGQWLSRVGPRGIDALIKYGIRAEKAYVYACRWIDATYRAYLGTATHGIAGSAGGYTILKYLPRNQKAWILKQIRQTRTWNTRILPPTVEQEKIDRYYDKVKKLLDE